MVRRFCPPTSNSALVIRPSEHTRTASISASNALPSAITVSSSWRSIAGACAALRSWKASSLDPDCGSGSRPIDTASSVPSRSASVVSRPGPRFGWCAP
jgi:hypothetical protein